MSTESLRFRREIAIIKGRKNSTIPQSIVDNGESMTKYDFMKLSEMFDGEISEADFTPEELEALLNAPKENWKEKYFEHYDDVKDKSLKKQDW